MAVGAVSENTLLPITSYHEHRANGLAARRASHSTQRFPPPLVDIARIRILSERLQESHRRQILSRSHSSCIDIPSASLQHTHTAALHRMSFVRWRAHCQRPIFLPLHLDEHPARHLIRALCNDHKSCAHLANVREPGCGFDIPCSVKTCDNP
jgi:hypothetical protein